MLGIYFSATGNSRFALETFIKELDSSAAIVSIEDSTVMQQLEKADEIVFSYPVQYSAVPKFVRDFIDKTANLWQGKKVFVIASMAMFSGDGSGVLARLLKKHGAVITGGLHVRMPDSICDEKVFDRPFEKNRQAVAAAKQKAQKAADRYKSGHPCRQGLGVLPRFAGFISQRVSRL